MTHAAAFCSNRQMAEPEIRAVAENLLQALRFFGYARKAGEIHDLPGVSLIFCGLNYAAFNAALLAKPIDGDERELSRLIQLCATQFESRNLRWTYWVCEDFLGNSLRRDASRIFRRHGLRPLTEAPGMYAAKLTPPDHSLPEIDVQCVADDRTSGAFAEIMSIAFDIPYSVCSAVYASEQAWTGGLRGYVGFSNGAAVTTAAAMITGDVIGLYSVATMPQNRRRGFAEAIMRKVIEEARRESGATRTVLQSTPSGLALYQKMGYRTVTNFNVYIAD